MLFNSAVFLFIFLPIFLAIYFISPKKIKNLIIFIFSIFFYAWGEKEIVLVMLASTVLDYFWAILIDKGKRNLGLILSLITNLSFLGIFKYADFAFENYNTILTYFDVASDKLLALPNIALPIGISFYTFQTLSYTIDVYRKKVKANYNFIDFGCYVTMFPQLIAGPIVRYESVYKQLKNRTVTTTKFVEGIERFIIGMAKKMILANTFGYVADDIFSFDPIHVSTTSSWLAVLCYTFQIYFDFSAYSDMAIGLGKMMGFDIPENFNYPYISKSIKEFWRRWHISLSTWFRDYLYIPLGGNRKGGFRTYVNLFIVFVVTGMWHGASWNFIIWGLWHGLFLIIERLGFDKILEKLWKPIQHFYCLFLVIIGWAIFRLEDFDKLKHTFYNMFVINKNAKLFPDFHLNNEVITMFILAIIFSMPVYKYKAILAQKFGKASFTIDIVFWVALFGLFFLSICLIAAGTYNPFIYFRF